MTEWLNARGIKLIGSLDVDRERIEHETGCVVETVKDEDLEFELFVALCQSLSFEDDLQTEEVVLLLSHVVHHVLLDSR